MCSHTLKHLRTLTGDKRRAAIRAHLAKSAALSFNLDPHTVTMSQQIALSDMAKAVSWRKSITSPLSLGLAFYVYLSREEAKIPQGGNSRNPQARQSFVYGRGRA
jgi:hypothetical protein